MVVANAPVLVDLDSSNLDQYPCCGIRNSSHPGLAAKRRWMETHFPLGLRAKVLVAPGGRPCGYIEYLPGEFAWRGVRAEGYLFIHCLWNHRKECQNLGWAGAMIEACFRDAKTSGAYGVAVMTRDRPWLAGRSIYLANGFELVDEAPPDCQLLVRKCKRSAPDPRFAGAYERKAAGLGPGLTIICSDQCPYIAKFADEITETAVEEYGLRPEIVELTSCVDAQDAPTPYAVFSIFYDGRLLADHQISRTRFRNIMNREFAGRA